MELGSQIATEERVVELRAIGPDNEATLNGLCDLFKEVFEGNFPIPGVYSKPFWRKRLGKGLQTVLAIYDGKFIGHVSIAVDSRDMKARHLLFPFLKPEYAELEAEFSKSLKDLCFRLSLFQDWSYATLYSCSKSKSLMQMLESELGFTPVGFLMQPEESRRHDIALSQRHFSKSKERLLYLSPELQGTAKELYERMGLEVTLASKRATQKPKKAKSQGEGPRAFPFQVGLRQRVVRSDKGPLAKDNGVPVILDCSSPDSLKLLDKYLKKGFYVNGVAPVLERQDAVILSQRSLNSVSMGGELSRGFYELKTRLSDSQN